MPYHRAIDVQDRIAQGANPPTPLRSSPAIRSSSNPEGYGISDDETQDLSANDQAARDDLRQLAGKYSNFRFVRLGNTHAKVLIKDSEFVAVTSFNWLSFKGDPRRGFRDEQGVLIQESSLVDGKFEYLVRRFDPTEAVS